MRADRIETLLTALDAKRIKNKGTKITSTCPLAPWRHKGGRDESPSFYVSVAEHDSSRCRCLSASCAYFGSLLELLWALQKASKRDLDKYINFVQQNDRMDVIGRLDRIESNSGFLMGKKDRTPAAMEGGLIAEDLIKQAETAASIDENHGHRVKEMQDLLMASSEALEYLKSPKRRVSDASIARWKLGWHPGQRRIAVPQYDRQGRLVNIGGRYVPSEHDDPLWKHQPARWMHAKDFKKELYLFGEHLFTSYDGKGTMFLVEGMFDAIGLDANGIPNAAAMNGSWISKAQYHKIVTWFDRLVIVPDGDQAGATAADKIVTMFAPKIAVEVYPTQSGLDPDEFGEDDFAKIRAMI